MNTLKKVLLVLALTLAVAILATGCRKDKCEHDWVERNVAEAQISTATCTEPAMYYKSCAKCHVISDTLTFEADFALGHTEVREAVAENLVSAADCLHPAVYKVYCSVCSADLGTFEDGTALGHDFQNIENSDNILYKQGCEKALTYYKSCARCGVTHESDVFTVGSALGHDPVLNTPHPDHMINPQTCDLAAKYYNYCARCNQNLETTFEVGEPLGHNYGQFAKNYAIATQKDCTNPATYYVSCEHCHDLDKTLPTFASGDPLGHNFREIESPEYLAGTFTCGDTPKYFKVCVRCHEHEVDAEGNDVLFEGDVLEHQIVVVDEVAPTKTTHGTAAHKHCTACGTYFDMEDNVIEAPATLHNYEWVHTEDGQSHYKACSVDGCTEPHTDEGDHTYDPNNSCDVTCDGGCGYERESQHVDENKDGKCEKCGGDVPADEVPDDGNLDNLTPWMPL